MSERLSVVGLGKLGMCLAACFAERGFETLGVDIEKSIVDSVNGGVAPWYEPGLHELLAKHAGDRLRATIHFKEAIENSDITFVLVATPSNSDGSFSNRFVESALRSLASAFKESQKPYHLFVISSTVMPGSIQQSFIPILEEYSGRELGKDFDVCFDPDFVALGNVVKGFLRPDLVIIGETSSEAGLRLEAIHNQLCENQPAISHMSIASAELAKVCLNAYITLKISFANSVANLCERVPGADPDAITKAIGADKRISPYYFQGGLSFGGTCFPRDTRAFISVATSHGIVPELIEAVERVNSFQDQHLADLVVREVVKLGRSATVGVLGLAFTPNTPVVTESPAIKLIGELLKRDLRIVAYDPLAVDNTRSIFGSLVEYVSSAAACLERSNLCVVTLRLAEFVRAVEDYDSNNPLTIVDCWREIDPGRLGKAVRYIPLGRSHSPEKGF